MSYLSVLEKFKIQALTKWRQQARILCADQTYTFMFLNRWNSTSPDGAVAKASANGLVGTGFASRYRYRVFKGPMGGCMATTPSSLSLTSNRVTTNY